MFKIEMTFMVPDDEIRLEKRALLVDNPDNMDEISILSSKTLAEDSETAVEFIEGVEYARIDCIPYLPNVIDGTRWKTLTEKEQNFYSLVENEKLFDFQDESLWGPTDEKPFRDFTEKDWGLA